MSESSTPGPQPRGPIRERDIKGLKYFGAISDLLQSLRGHKDCPNRQLHYDQLAALVLLHFFNPVLTGLRSLQQASTLRNVQAKLGVKRASLGSLSEASRVFDPQLLQGVFQELVAGIAAAAALPKPQGLPAELAPVAMDATLLEALPRMLWALWQDREHRAVKVHLEFDVIQHLPKAAVLTDGNGNDKEVLRSLLAPGKIYLLDAGYGEYRLFEEIRGRGSSFVARLRDNAVYDLVEERALSADDLQAGVVSDRVVWLGSAKTRLELATPVRVVLVRAKSPPERGLARRASRVSSKKTFRHRPEEYELLLVTDRMDLPAETIALLYRHRWTIELFFRWLKCTLRLKHLLFESRNGVTLLVYCALIASLLVTLWTGRKPTKRTLEMIQLYFQGWAELDELEAHIAKLSPIAP